MASEQQLERSMLDGKDREELHAIAGAMGVKGITRLRKADLVDAILAAAAGQGGGGNGSKSKALANGATKKRAVRSKKASELSGGADLAALAAEEAELAKAGSEPEPQIAPRPARGSADTATATEAPAAAPAPEATTTAEPATAPAPEGNESSGDPRVEADDERASYGEGNRSGRRRRRRGRDRGQGGHRVGRQRW